MTKQALASKTDKPKKVNGQPKLNHRRALAGIYLLQNPSCSMREALARAGYSESVQRKPQANGISAERCIAEARKLDPSTNPATAIQEALATTRLRLAQCLHDEESLKNTNLGQLGRILEVLNRWYGDKLPTRGDSPSAFVDKVEWLDGVLTELRARRTKGEVIDVDSLPAQPTAALEASDAPTDSSE